MKRTIAAAVLSASSVLGALSVPASAASAPSATLSQIATYVAASVKTIVVPDVTATLPPLATVTASVAHIPTPCFNDRAVIALPSSPATTCAFGDRSVTRRIVVFGDANAAMWIPAFIKLGQQLHWKVIFLGRPGCSAWASLRSAGTVSCRTFIHAVVHYIATTKPRYVIPIGAKVHWRATKRATQAQIEREIVATIDLVRATGSHVILMSPVPQFNPGFTERAPTICFSDKGSNLWPCELVIRHFAHSSAFVIAQSTVAYTHHVTLIPTVPLFCTVTKCAVYVTTPDATYLVYRNRYEITAAYMSFIGGAVATLMRPSLR